MLVIIFMTTFPWETGNATFQVKAPQLIFFWGGQNKASTFWIKMTEGTNPKTTCLHKNKATSSRWILT